MKSMCIISTCNVQPLGVQIQTIPELVCWARPTGAYTRACGVVCLLSCDCHVTSLTVSRRSSVRQDAGPGGKVLWTRANHRKVRQFQAPLTCIHCCSDGRGHISFFRKAPSRTALCRLQPYLYYTHLYLTHSHTYLNYVLTPHMHTHARTHAAHTHHTHTTPHTTHTHHTPPNPETGVIIPWLCPTEKLLSGRELRTGAQHTQESRGQWHTSEVTLGLPSGRAPINTL